MLITCSTGDSNWSRKNQDTNLTRFAPRTHYLSGQTNQGPWWCYRTDTRLRSEAVWECTLYLSPLSDLSSIILQQLKVLEQSIESLRGSVPKPKFSFKRKQPLVQQQAPLSEVVANPPVQKRQPVSIASNSLVLSSRSNEYLTTAAPLNYSEPSDVSIYNLDNCVVDFLGKAKNETPKISALHGRNLTNCVLYLPLIEGSVLLHDLKQCVIVLGCHQVC